MSDIDQEKEDKGKRIREINQWGKNRVCVSVRGGSRDGVGLTPEPGKALGQGATGTPKTLSLPEQLSPGRASLQPKKKGSWVQKQRQGIQGLLAVVLI